MLDMVEYGAMVDENWESREAALNVLGVKVRGSITDICRSSYTRDCWGLKSPASSGQRWFRVHLSAHTPLR
jgi:hypothetical protein